MLVLKNSQNARRSLSLYVGKLLFCIIFLEMRFIERQKFILVALLPRSTPAAGLSPQSGPQISRLLGFRGRPYGLVSAHPERPGNQALGPTNVFGRFRTRIYALKNVFIRVFETKSQDIGLMLLLFVNILQIFLIVVSTETYRY